MTEENEQQVTPPKQVCSIRIGFPVDSDDEAIMYKKKISTILADIPMLRIEFVLMTAPAGKPPRIM